MFGAAGKLLDERVLAALLAPPDAGSTHSQPDSKPIDAGEAPYRPHPRFGIVGAPLDSYDYLRARRRGRHYIPLPIRTYGIVCRRILMSAQSDQFATYR
jgi:hypothetical protein